MTLGELVDLLAQVKDAQDRVADAEQARHGGDKTTMDAKNNWLGMCQSDLDRLRSEKLPFVVSSEDLV